MDQLFLNLLAVWNRASFMRNSPNPSLKLFVNKLEPKAGEPKVFERLAAQFS